MKTTTNYNKASAQMLAICLTALSAFSSLAQTSSGWQTVLDYQYPGGTAEGHRIAADASGNVFSGGDGSDAAGITRGMVLKTDTAQASWLVSDDNNPNPSQYESFVWDLGLDVSGNIYSVGQLTPNSTGIPYWYIRKSSDSGLNWSNAGDPYQYAVGQWINATGFAADNSGNIYVVGWGRDASKKSYLHWLVRKSTDGGAHWTLVDDVQGPTSNFGAAGAGFVPGVGVFVVGYPYGSSWVVRRSASGDPGTWLTVDGPFAGGAQAVGSDGQGNIYVVGSQVITVTIKTRPLTTSSYSVWATRMSSDGGSTWSTVDAFSYPSNKGTCAYGIGRNSAGNVVVVGRGSDAQGKLHWLARTPDTSGAWQTVDDFKLAPGYHASALGVATDAADNLLVSGFAYDATGSHWIVRRLSANP